MAPVVQALCPDSCQWPEGGRDYFRTYYTNQIGGGPGNARGLWNLLEAPTNVYSGQQFIDWMRPWINDTSNGSINDHTGAASAVINLMMGRSGASFGGSFIDGVNHARDNWDEWSALVLYYDSRGWVNWEQSNINCGPYDQANLDLSIHEIYYWTSVSGCTSDMMIVFHNPETDTTFSMKKICGNITGHTGPLTQPPTVPPPAPPPLPPPPPPPPPPHTFFDANGGDVAAGASMVTGTGTSVVPCDAPHIEEAGILSWNDYAAAGYPGAGSQYAALAMGYIQEFVTNQDNNQPTQGEPNGLTFANTNNAESVKIDSGMFGGMFGSAPCVDYWAKVPSAPTGLPAGPISGWPNGTYYVQNDVDLTGGGAIPAGKKITLYVEGDATITGNITYSQTGWTSRALIPSFKLIVHGVVYIDRSVTTLDGLYAAIPDTGYVGTPTTPAPHNQFSAPQNGTITTCSRVVGGVRVSYDPSKVGTTDATMAADCAAKLTFNGSVAALQVWPLRTGGSTASGVAAETFNYTPEMWLSPSGSTTSGGNADYQTIIGLPPVL